MYVRAGRPAFAWPYAGVHRSTSLISSSLLLQQCPAYLVRLTCIDFVTGGMWKSFNNKVNFDQEFATREHCLQLNLFFKGINGDRSFHVQKESQPDFFLVIAASGVFSLPESLFLFHSRGCNLMFNPFVKHFSAYINIFSVNFPMVCSFRPPKYYERPLFKPGLRSLIWCRFDNLKTCIFMRLEWFLPETHCKLSRTYIYEIWMMQKNNNIISIPHATKKKKSPQV